MGPSPHAARGVHARGRARRYPTDAPRTAEPLANLKGDLHRRHTTPHDAVELVEVGRCVRPGATAPRTRHPRGCRRVGRATPWTKHESPAPFSSSEGTDGCLGSATGFANPPLTSSLTLVSRSWPRRDARRLRARPAPTWKRHSTRSRPLVDVRVDEGLDIERGAGAGALFVYPGVVVSGPSRVSHGPGASVDVVGRRDRGAPRETSSLRRIRPSHPPSRRWAGAISSP